MKKSASQPSSPFEEMASRQSHDAAQTLSAQGVSGASASSRIAEFPDHATETGSPGAADLPEAQDAGRQSTWKWGLLALAIVIGVVAWRLLRDPSAPAAVADPTAATLELAEVDVATIEPRVLTQVLPLSGTLTPFVQATLKSKVGGEVEQVTVREGQDVKAGEVIARIDTRNLQAQYDRAAAAVDKARADLDLARLNRDKNRAMLEQKYISQNTYEATESAYAGNVASLKLAEADARLAHINLEDAVVRAPFDGAIARRLVQPGENVSPDSAIVNLVDLREMVLEAAVPAGEIPSVKVGQSARFRVSGFGERAFEGVVRRINPITAEGSRAITIYISTPNPDRALKGGMFAQGRLTLESTEPVVAVAQRAVRDEAGAPYVFLLKEGKVVRTPVALGAAADGGAYVEVLEGLAAGDRVIVAAIGDDKAGSKAAVRASGAAGASTTLNR